MKIQNQNELKIKLRGSDTNTFKSIINKLSSTKNKIGFTQSPFNDKEEKLIKRLEDNLNK